MHWSWRIGSLGGIAIRIHATFPLVLIWALFLVGTPSRYGWAAAATMLGLTLLLFVCVLLHELGHGLVATRLGVPVRDITLLPIGGVARMERMTDRPSYELLITAAGPLVNLLIAAAIGAALLATGRSDGVDDLFRVLSPTFAARSGLRQPELLLRALLLTNLFLALFNLLPAFPLDGGRILRALLALGIGFDRATQVAVTVGQSIAFLLVGLYLAPTVTGARAFQPSPGLLFIALFVFVFAGQEGQLQRVRRVLRHVSARQALRGPDATLAPEQPLAMALQQSLWSNQRDFAVVVEGRLVGLLSRNELQQGIRRHGPDASVGQVMRTRFPVAEADENLFDVQQRMAADGTSAIPVVEFDRYLGLLTLESIWRHYSAAAAGDEQRRVV